MADVGNEQRTRGQKLVRALPLEELYVARYVSTDVSGQRMSVSGSVESLEGLFSPDILYVSLASVSCHSN